jgi:head-tail adaptor
MIIGKMRYDIIVQKKINIRGEFGEFKEEWSDYLNLKADVIYNNGGKTIDNDEIFNTQQITFTIYYRDVKEDMIIIFNNKKYQINFINEIPYKQGIIISAELINE